MQPTQLLTSVKGKNFRKLDALGQGQYGKVYKVADDQGNVFAMKEIIFDQSMNQKTIKSLMVEQNIMELIDHPRILRLQDKIIRDNSLCLITTFCDGGDLEDLLLRKAKNEGFGEKVAWQYLREIADAFTEFRRYKIIHRDLKLANIFLKEGHVVIGDFGFAKLGVSTTDSKLGTPYYMAPEILRSQKGVYSSKCDLWSIGVCFYLLLFGVLPFDANSLNELKSKIEMNSGERLIIPKHQTITFETKNLLMRLLEKHQDKRISFNEFFALCGVKFDPNARSYNTLPTREDIEEENFEDQSFFQSQIQNTGQLKTGNNNLLVPGVNAFGQQQGNSPRNDHRFPVSPNSKDFNGIPQGEYKHRETPLHSYQTMSNELSGQGRVANQDSSLNQRFWQTLQEEKCGFLFPKPGTNFPQSLPYINELNRILFYLHTMKAIKSCQNLGFAQLSSGELSATLMITQIFLVRKIDLKLTELGNCLRNKTYVFKLPQFSEFTSSIAYSELIAFTEEQYKYVVAEYSSLFRQFQKENPKNASDFKMYTELPLAQLDPALKKLSQKLYSIFLANSSAIAGNERYYLLQGLLKMIYATKVVPYPVVFEEPKQWMQFDSALKSKESNEVENFIKGLKFN